MGAGVRMQEEENGSHQLSRNFLEGENSRNGIRFQLTPITQLFPVTGKSQ